MNLGYQDSSQHMPEKSSSQRAQKCLRDAAALWTKPRELWFTTFSYLPAVQRNSLRSTGYLTRK
jgi:hypothetical protein